MFNLNAILSTAFAQLAARKAKPTPRNMPDAEPSLWACHAATQAKRARRALIRKVGRRQAIRQIKAERRTASA